MPPVVICLVGAVGALAAAKWIMRESRRINAELHPERFRKADQSADSVRLRRDASGVYRPL